jgi:hypothetical protein
MAMELPSGWIFDVRIQGRSGVEPLMLLPVLAAIADKGEAERAVQERLGPACQALLRTVHPIDQEDMKAFGISAGEVKQVLLPPDMLASILAY